MLGVSAEPKATKRKPRRNPFPHFVFFCVPVLLFDSGLVRCIGPSATKRYLTLCRVANYNYGKTKIQADLGELEKLDGVSERACWLANRKLKEYGLIDYFNTRPFTYILLQPSSWKPPKPFGPKITQRDPLKVEELGTNSAPEAEVGFPAELAAKA